MRVKLAASVPRSTKKPASSAAWSSQESWSADEETADAVSDVGAAGAVAAGGGVGAGDWGSSFTTVNVTVTGAPAVPPALSAENGVAVNVCRPSDGVHAL